MSPRPTTRDTARRRPIRSRSRTPGPTSRLPRPPPARAMARVRPTLRDTVPARLTPRSRPNGLPAGQRRRPRSSGPVRGRNPTTRRRRTSLTSLRLAVRSQATALIVIVLMIQAAEPRPALRPRLLPPKPPPGLPARRPAACRLRRRPGSRAPGAPRPIRRRIPMAGSRATRTRTGQDRRRTARVATTSRAATTSRRLRRPGARACRCRPGRPVRRRNRLPAASRAGPDGYPGRACAGRVCAGRGCAGRRSGYARAAAGASG